jgi:hypothetical protein
MHKSPGDLPLGRGRDDRGVDEPTGMRRVDLVVEDEATMLTPVEGTAEGGGSS